MAVLPIGLMFCAFVPVFVFAKRLDRVLALTALSARQPRVILCAVAFLISVVLLMCAGYALVCLFRYRLLEFIKRRSEVA